MASDLKTLVRAADVMRKARLTDRSMAPKWTPATRYVGVEDAVAAAKKALLVSVLDVVKADLTNARAKDVDAVLEKQAAQSKSTSRRLELLAGHGNVVRDAMVASWKNKEALARDLADVVDDAAVGRLDGDLESRRGEVVTQYERELDANIVFPLFVEPDAKSPAEMRGGGGRRNIADTRISHDLWNSALKTLRAR